MADIGRTAPLSQTPGWAETSQALGKLQGHGDQHLRTEAGQKELHLHDSDKWHGIGSPKDKYKAAVLLIKASIDKDFGPGSGDQVFRNIGIKKNSEGLKFKQIDKLQQEMAKLGDAQTFRYENLNGHKAVGDGMRGNTVTQTAIQGFHVLSTHDKDTVPKSGDKVHISVAPNDVPRAWNLVMPILLEHSDTVKSFKVTDMESARGDADADRVYQGAQITVYLDAPEGVNKNRDFAKVMKEVSGVLEHAGINRGQQPESDLQVNGFVSYRHEFDDLRPGNRVESLNIQQMRDYVDQGDMTPKDFDEWFENKAYMSPRDPAYAQHKEAMQQQPIYQALLKEVNR